MAKTKATNTSTETNKEAAVSGMKAFRSSSEIENLYRFIHDNNLRTEARSLIELVVAKMSPAKKKRGRKKVTIQ
ncbi:MAG: hypothetical protein VYA54_09105 [Bdellovibrionota bacterium]|nr:hypothetical protein [Bdellovibrionota bacterium]